MRSEHACFDLEDRENDPARQSSLEVVRCAGCGTRGYRRGPLPHVSPIGREGDRDMAKNSVRHKRPLSTTPTATSRRSYARMCAAEVTRKRVPELVFRVGRPDEQQ